MFNKIVTSGNRDVLVSERPYLVMMLFSLYVQEPPTS